MTRDRTVHARFDRWDGMAVRYGTEVVRYDRAGKWYLEFIRTGDPRKRVSLSDAATAAAWGAHYGGGEIFFDKPGGGAFDRKVREYQRVYLRQ